MSGIPAGAGSLIGKRLGRYEVLALLALGGTAEIYLARIGGAAGFEKYVVIKCLHDHLADDPDFVKMFLDEARLAAVLDHTNIVQTFELGEHENRYYMAMEFLAGLSLAMVARRASEREAGGKIPAALVVNIAAQTAAGLHYAHERTANGKPLNVVHRDISPQNLVLGFEGVVKVVDFGIARAELRETKTKAGTIKGKFAYMSPEQCIATNVDRRTDVFALGVIVHELLTGSRLFKRTSPYETYQAVIECSVPPPSSLNHELDPALDAIVMKAVARDKDARYASAEAFSDALLGYLHARGKGAGPGEVGRWFDEHFAEEIEEHGERMRELIAGRAADARAWDEEEEKQAQRDKAKELETVDIAKRGSIQVLHTADIEIARDSQASLEQLVTRLKTDSETSANAATIDEDAPPERTRIEQNPLELLKELDAPRKSPTADKKSAASTRPTMAKPTGGQPVALPLPGGPARRVPDGAQLPQVRKLEERPSPTGPPLPPSFAIPPASAAHAATSAEAAAAAARASPYPVVIGGRPFSSELAPSVLPTPQRATLMAAPPAPASAPGLVSTISPVGEAYAPRVNWNLAAARRARALTPVRLALLFVGALGIALLLTTIIAKIIH